MTVPKRTRIRMDILQNMTPNCQHRADDIAEDIFGDVTWSTRWQAYSCLSRMSSHGLVRHLRNDKFKITAAGMEFRK